MRSTLTAEEKHLVEKHENDFDGLIVRVTFTSSSSRDGGDYRERVFREEFLGGWVARDDCALPCGGTGKGGHPRAEVNLKTRGGTRDAHNGICRPYRSTAKIIFSFPQSPRFLLPPSSGFPLRSSARSIFRSLAREDPGPRVFTANIPKKRLHVTTRR